MLVVSDVAAYALHLSHRERSARASVPGEGLEPIESHLPPHPNPLPNGEREPAAACGKAAA
jgi:hypothetical protein